MPCYALYMMHGYLRKIVNTNSRARLNKYVSKNFRSWIQHGEAEGTWPWVLVCATLKAKSWSLAAATKPGLSTKPAKAELKKVDRFDNVYHWSTSNRAVIGTRYGPSSSSMKSLEKYLISLDPDSQEYQDTEECHCVALQAIGLHPQDQGGRERTRSLYQGSQSSIRSAFSWRTTPNDFRPTTRNRLEVLHE